MQRDMFELFERNACWICCRRAGDGGQVFGISSPRLGDMGLLASREVAIVAFNRAMCVGTVAPATETEFDEGLGMAKGRTAPLLFPIGRRSRVQNTQRTMNHLKLSLRAVPRAASIHPAERPRRAK